MLEVKKVRGKWCVVCGKHVVQQFKSITAANKALHNDGAYLYGCVCEGLNND